MKLKDFIEHKKSLAEKGPISDEKTKKAGDEFLKKSLRVGGLAAGALGGGALAHKFGGKYGKIASVPASVLGAGFGYQGGQKLGDYITRDKKNKK